MDREETVGGLGDAGTDVAKLEQTIKLFQQEQTKQTALMLWLTVANVVIALVGVIGLFVQIARAP